MSSKRYPEEFKIEAVKQVTDSGHSAPDVAKRLGVSQPTLYECSDQESFTDPDSRIMKHADGGFELSDEHSSRCALDLCRIKASVGIRTLLKIEGIEAMGSAGTVSEADTAHGQRLIIKDA